MLEKLTLWHLVTLVGLATWLFGGGSTFAYNAICIIGSLAPLITIASLIDRRSTGRSYAKPLLLLIPWLGFNAFVLISTLQPSFRVATIEGGQVFIPRNDLSSWPSCARPELALQELWLRNAIILSAFNLLIAVRHRRTLHYLLSILAVNALVLAVFGSIQKFVSAPGIFFGRVSSPNSTFFASFIYHNHWGAFMVLMIAACLGLLFSIRPWSGYRDFWHSPAIAAVVAVFFLVVTIPLSGSRSCTMLLVLLLAGALIHGLRRVIRHHKEQKRSATVPGLLIMLIVVISLGAVFVLTRQSIEVRLADTKTQIDQMQNLGNIGARSQLYRDTWHMAKDKLWFGWGLGSYGTVFRNYNTLQASDNLPQYYEYAHSDWLQLLAETGVVGVTFYVSFLTLLFRPLRRANSIASLPRYLLGGCALILLYAWIEFPFGNPAVTLSFWICLFCAVTWIKLDQSKATT